MQANVTEKENEDEEDRFRRYYLNNWHKTWAAFNLALRSTDDFNAFEWCFKLLKSVICFGYFKFGLYKLKLHIYWRSCVPVLAIVLIVVVVVSYFGSLREIINERWCCPTAGTEGGINNSCSRVDESGWCRWLLFHDAVVVYLGLMIIFNFLSACFRSPGVVLAKQQVKDSEKKESMIANKRDSQIQKEYIKWSSKDSRGGICGIDPILNIAREEFLVQNYYNFAGLSKGSRKCNTNINSKKEQNQVFPINRETFCNKCWIKRPPRCHHCSICDRCVLQFDHHCVWLNNCVGYNNHRAFLLTLFYLNLGCWYGIFLLYRPFLEVLNTSTYDHGWHFFHDNKNALLDLPSVSAVFSCILRGTNEKEIIIKIVFPFLFAIGFLQAIFFRYHMFYVVSALTTLEYKILLDMQFNNLVEHSSSRVTPPNPFNRGWSQNLKNALGPIPLLFLPIQVDPKQLNLTSKVIAQKEK